MIEHWHWPQYTQAILFALGVFVNIVREGQVKTDKYGGWLTWVSYTVGVYILYAGGFWTPAQ